MEKKLKDGQKITIRKLRISDLDLFYNFLVNSPKARKFWRHPADYETASNYVNAQRYQIVATIKKKEVERILGFAAVTDQGGIGLAVTDEYQHRGIGTILMERLVEKAQKLKLEHLEFTVFKENTAVQFYSSLGCQICDETPDGHSYIMRLMVGKQNG